MRDEGMDDIAPLPDYPGRRLLHERDGQNSVVSKTPEVPEPTSLPEDKPRAWEWVCRVAFVVLLLVGLPIALNRAIRDVGGTDFMQFYRAGRHVLEHGDTTPQRFLKYYWPSLDVAWAGIAWMPVPVACILYYVFSCGTWIGLLASTGKWLLGHVAQPARRQAVLLAGLLVMPLVLDHLCLGAFHILMVWLLVAGLGRAAHGRPWSGGLLLGLAIWVKLLPLLGVGYLIWKRKWLPAGVALASAIAVNLALSAPVFGWQRIGELHEQWWRDQATGTTHRLLDLISVVDEDRLSDQSLAVIMRRTLTRMGWDNVCPERRAVALGDLTPMQLRVSYYGVLALLGAGLLVACWKTGRRTSPVGWAREIALMALATLWFSPVAWSYHPTAVGPALAVVFSRHARQPRLAWLTGGVWLLGMALLGSQLGRAAGEMLWTTFALGVALLAASRETADRQTANEATGGYPGLNRAA